MFPGLAPFLLLQSHAKVQEATVTIFRKKLIPNSPADLVQDLYLKEIKAYKPAPVVRLKPL